MPNLGSGLLKGAKGDPACAFFSSLLRLSKIKKFMVGCEMLVYPQRNHTSERTAVLLRMQNLKYIIDSDQIQ